MFRQKRSTSNGKLWIGTIVGGLLGAAGALLYAPQKGDMTRRSMKEQWASMRSGKLSHGMMEMGKEWAEDVSDEVKERTKATNYKKPSTLHSKRNQMGEMIQDVLENERPSE